MIWPGGVVDNPRIVPDNSWIVDAELERLAVMLRGGSTRHDYRRRFLQLAGGMADFQGETVEAVAGRYGLDVVDGEPTAEREEKRVVYEEVREFENFEVSLERRELHEQEARRGRKPAWTREEKRHERTPVRAVRDNPVAVVIRDGSIRGTSL